MRAISYCFPEALWAVAEQQPRYALLRTNRQNIRMQA